MFRFILYYRLLNIYISLYHITNITIIINENTYIWALIKLINELIM